MLLAFALQDFDLSFATSKSAVSALFKDGALEGIWRKISNLSSAPLSTVECLIQFFLQRKIFSRVFLFDLNLALSTIRRALFLAMEVCTRLVVAIKFLPSRDPEMISKLR